ncbi:MAG: hypothetical protein VX871_07595 [Pseudomonadota bacterium]|nr:hypothetical protein [Pseudomonadota bacterium]
MKRRFSFIAALLVFFAHAAVTNAPVTALDATPDDTARILAGLRPAPTSPLAPMTQDPAWQSHASAMNASWAELDQRQLSRARVWSLANLGTPSPVMFYMFSGPDFPNAEALFPRATTYVFAGLEPVGPLPDVIALPPAKLPAALGELRASLGNFLQYGYFITRDMGTDMRSGSFTGVLPVLYLSLARSGMTITGVTFLNLDGKGGTAPLKSGGKARPRGVRIDFAGPAGGQRTLYYFSTDLSDGGVGKSGFLKFCEKLGGGDSLLKSASYLMHVGGFSRVRGFLLANSATLVQDDSGIPLKYFEPGRWRLRPFGQYLPPIDEFKRHEQPDMAQLFAGASPVNFGMGYHWHASRTNILVADRVTGPAPPRQ